ncbi:MAG: 23S rRNA (adenine(2503)-C(2))-methyltransferase RlmN [Firmicutes bacterium]|nr:23S rRNA (adenine(2503)-C(2))-methyltransferase RlmN [Bacillota bacterium]
MRSGIDLGIDEWRAYLTECQEKPFLAVPIFRWIHAHHVSSFDEMSDVPLRLREKLKEEFRIDLPKILGKETAEDETAKYLVEFQDTGTSAECVLMKYRFGYSLCISSQAGCRMGCRFCASTLRGLDRNLTGGEMAGQIYAVEKDAKVSISHVVVMGCGEPFDNIQELFRFLNLIHEEEGKNLSLRNITVSTCGLPDQIRIFTDRDLPVTLAVSLHAPNDTVRKKIMRIAQAVSMEELMDACRYYTGKTNRRITFEYLLIDHLNDSRALAEELCALLSGLLCHVNVIPVNPVKECGFERPKEERIRQFIEVLEHHHIPVTRRREMGKSIDAACGQLRHKRQLQALREDSHA